MKKLTLSIALSIMLSSMTSAEVLFVEQDEGTFAAPMTSETLFASNDTSHYHEVDRDRENHTGTQTASTISDFDISVNNLIDNYNIDDTYKLLTLEDFVDNKIANAAVDPVDLSSATINPIIDDYQIDATYYLSTLPGYVDSKIANASIPAANITDLNTIVDGRIANAPVYFESQEAFNTAVNNLIAAAEPSGGGSADLPVGFIYTQYPGKQSPADLGLTGTWTEINYDGAFFRASGTNADAFQTVLGSPQNDSIKAHQHILGSAAGAISNTGTTPIRGFYNGTDPKNHFTSLVGDTETRPVNYTVRIWEKTGQ